MDNHKRKMIAPIVITILMIFYYFFYFGLIIAALHNVIAAILLGVIPIILAGTMLYVCIQRMKEIRSGEEDDLSQY